MKYPIGIQDFKRIREDGFVYVDKTAYIADLVNNNTPYFLSRPRRFGKSLLLSTIQYYFQGEKDLFEGLAISKTEKEWRKHPVFMLSFNGLDPTDDDTLNKNLSVTLYNWEKELNIEPQDASLGIRFYEILSTAYATTGEKCVVLIDEYDKPLLDCLGTPKEEKNRNILASFFSILKDADKFLCFLMVTGVTKFSHVTLFSGANQLKDISMDARYDAICGITQEELTTDFTEGIQYLADSLNCTYDDALASLKKRYDGYHFTEKMTDVYNPFSLLRALDAGKLSDYWFATGSLTALVKAVGNVGKVNIEKMIKEYHSEAEFVDYKATTENLLPLFYQSGYLTIKEVNKDLTGELQYKLDFPNEEVSRAYSILMLNTFYISESSGASWVSGISNAILAGDTKKLRQNIRALFADIPYTARPPKEDDNYRVHEAYFHTAFFIIVKTTGTYMVINEKMNAKGRADLIIETPKFIYIWEFKLDRPASMGTKQIKQRDYAAPYAADNRKLIRIAASFSSQDLTLKDWEENGVRINLDDDDDDDDW